VIARHHGAGRRARSRRGRAAGGFTLLELAAVVVIMVLLVGMVLPSLGLGSRRALDGEAEGLRAALELARQRAIATGTPHRLALDLDDASFRLEHWATAPPEEALPPDPRAAIDLRPPRASGGSFEPLPSRQGRLHVLDEDVFIAWVETAEGEVDDGVATVAFFEDGSATAAHIRLETQSGDGVELEVLPLADSVRVHAVP
jgi:type II secretory pathway pseudopilin PulG